MASKRRARKNQQPKKSPRYDRAIKIEEGNFQRLDRRLESLNVLVGEIASVEVNTSLVDKITTEKFIPWQVYQQLHAISRLNLEKLNIHSSLREHYLSLRRQLELEYAFLLVNPTSELYDEKISKQVKQDLAILTQPNNDWENLLSRLPNPLDSDNPSVMLTLHKLLRDYPFLRTLRKLGELKNVLDRRNQVVWQSESADMIYAQTRIQLGGQISNCYDQKLLNHPHRKTILELHREGVEAGEKHWQGLLEFIITIVHKYK